MKHQIEILRRPEDESGAESAETAKTRAVSKRAWLNDAGEEVAEELASKVTYTYLADGRSVEFKFAKPGSMESMLAGFGWHTLMGNLANTWKNSTEPGDRSESPIEDMIARNELLASGKWIDRTGTVGVPRYDKDVLAICIYEVLQAKGVAKGDAAAYRVRIEDEKGYGAKALKNSEVAELYRSKSGKAAVTADELA